MKNFVRIIGGILLLLVCILPAGCAALALRTDEITVEAGKEFVFCAADFFDVDEESAEDFTADTSAVDTSKTGDYEIHVTCRKSEYTITVHVRDTTAPVLTAAETVIFTNDPAGLNPEDFALCTDATECTWQLHYVEMLSDSAADDDTLEALLDESINAAGAEYLFEQGSAACEEEGVYSAVYAVTDEGGNSAYGQILIIFDATAPEISGLSDCTVQQEDISAEPEISFEDVTITDNMDGSIDISELKTDLSLSDEENYVYILTVSVSDRAGNTAVNTYTYTVTAAEEETHEEETHEEEETESQETEDESESTGAASASSDTAAAEESTSSSDSAQDYSWVGELDIAQSVSQLIIVSAGSGYTAELSMYEKTSEGWELILAAAAYIGRNGIGKTEENDGKTPTGVYYFTLAFGNNANPGTSLSYTHVDSTYYWVDDSDSAYYNQLVSTKYVTADWSSAEHISSSPNAYAYCLALNYNSSCTPYKGSAIFLHCSIGKATSGCISIPQSDMITVLKNVNSDCAVIIDYSYNITDY